MKYFTIFIFSIFLFIGLSPGQLNAQDPVYSQFYAAPLQMNAALTGTTYAPRIMLNYRNQWPGMMNAYVTYSASYDQFVESISSGFGLSVSADNAGDGIYRTTNIGGHYAYSIQVAENFFLRGGLEANMYQVRLDWDRLIFPNDLDPIDGIVDQGNGEIRPDQLTKNHLSLGTGVLGYARWGYIGVSLKHLNSPDESFLAANSIASIVPLRLGIQAGGEIPISTDPNKRDKQFISPNIVYLNQGEFSQINVGAFLRMNAVFGGAWYRHAGSNGDAIIAMAGVQFGVFRFAYSYDITVSGLSGVSGGAHEVSLVINFDDSEEVKRRRKSRMYMECPGILR